jgi:hypothetical protein
MAGRAAGGQAELLRGAAALTGTGTRAARARRPSRSAGAIELTVISFSLGEETIDGDTYSAQANVYGQDSPIVQSSPQSS